MFYACLSLSIIFVIIAGLLTILGARGAMLIGGFNTLLEAQRNLYDKSKLVKAMRNSLLLWALILAGGAVLSYFVSQYFGIISFIIWLIVFFRDFHWDAKKAFEKYKI